MNNTTVSTPHVKNSNLSYPHGTRSIEEGD
jgi:hypothetical protein